MKRRDLSLALFAAMVAGSLGARPQVPPASTVARPSSRSGVVVVPERFVRRWDPVTIFLERDVGAAQGGPEDHPEAHVVMEPEHPGAFEWLDARTLQFRPADPWPALGRFTFTVGDQVAVLESLMDPPQETIPGEGATDLPPVERVTLGFADPVDPVALAEMVRLELRPLPGVEAGAARWLTGDDFTVKVIERRSLSDACKYELALGVPIPSSTRVLVHLRLARTDPGDESFHRFGFSTAEPFRVREAGASWTRYPVARGGSRYPRSQAILGDLGWRSVSVHFTRTPKDPGDLVWRNLLRITPPVDDLVYSLQDAALVVTGGFEPEVQYQATLVPTELQDQLGRSLEMAVESSFFFHFPAQPRYLRWRAGHGVVERYGPRLIPVEGRGDARVDLRVHPVDPLDRTFWPFPSSAVEVDEATRPPGPGEEPAPHIDPSSYVDSGTIARNLRTLGSPPISRVVALPLAEGSGAASFGFDVGPHLDDLAGEQRPGHYLVGLRRLGEATRSWTRIQVTDLVVTTVEVDDHVRFLVTSLRDGLPVRGARVRVEGVKASTRHPTWTTHFDGATDASGITSWHSYRLPRDIRIMRVVVESQGDVLVLNAQDGPDSFRAGTWSAGPGTWLQGGGLSHPDEYLTHVFTDRPLYKPDETVHIKGWVRTKSEGILKPLGGTAVVVVQSPDGRTRRHKVSLGESGSFYYRFQEDGLPTGSYTARLEEDAEKKRDWERKVYGQIDWRMEAYRVPRFEVNVNAPDTVPLDKPFEVSLGARYYAGGRVAGQAVRWRVTRTPYAWTPGKPREGFLYSSDGRYSRSGGALGGPTTEQGVTDANGTATIRVDPTTEQDARPRLYTFEATVIGADDQTVSASGRVKALPPFVLGLKVPRYLERAAGLRPEVLVVGPDGTLLPDKPVTLRVLRREWHSHLREGDFATGEARYVTDQVDVKVHEATVTSRAEPLAVDVPLTGAGVYVVELEAQDHLGRAQVVAVDLFAGGDEAVTWKKPSSQVLSVSTEKESYASGETARFVLQSPFQEARALAVIEAPEGNDYRWLEVAGGKAVLEVEVPYNWVPRIPVHFVLWRGRLAGTAPAPDGTDLGKPATVAATRWIEVTPDDNRVEVSLASPQKATPGEEIEVTVKLSAPDGRPLAGEVTLWLVDQAVLALGKEKPLDPLPSFLTANPARAALRDTRALAFGYLPFAEMPGGGWDDEADSLAAGSAAPMAEMARRSRNGHSKELGEDITVRKNFASVPYFEPTLVVGESGELKVKVKLPDNLTTFKLRAKAISGAERFGFAKGQVAVGLPVLVQPTLPRFLRPGDRFRAAAVSRVVEGDGGEGKVRLVATAATLLEPDQKTFTWKGRTPEVVRFQVEVPTPAYREDGAPEVTEARFKMVVVRSSDGAGDAFEAVVPVLPDRREVVETVAGTLARLEPFVVPAPRGQARPGTLRRRLRVSDRADVLRAVAATDYLLAYPHGCTEQRLSKGRAFLALEGLRGLVGEGGDRDLREPVQELLAWLPGAVGSDGLAAYWPGSQGYVSLTAWVVEFLVDAREAGFAIDTGFLSRLTGTLQQALRSDYTRFIEGESYLERVYALSALASAGKLDAAYAAELARRARNFGPEPMADLVRALARHGDADSYTARQLRRELWEALVFKLWQGEERYGGMQATRRASGLVLPSESRTLAKIMRALRAAGDDDPRVALITRGLVERGDEHGWGTTNANAAALSALATELRQPQTNSPSHIIGLRAAGKDETLGLGANAPVALWRSTAGGPFTATRRSADGPQPVILQAEARYLPVASGAEEEPHAEGFVVERRMLLVGAEGGGPEKQVELAGRRDPVQVAVGQVIEEHVRVVNPEDHFFVAVDVPLAGGLEPLNPNLATAPPEARPSHSLTREPSYAAYLDDRVTFYFDELPRGSYDFYFRTRATIEGSFVQPAARAEAMYDESLHGGSAGARVEVRRVEGP